MTNPAAVEGLDEFVRALGRVDRSAAGEVRKALKRDVGAPFVQDVKDRIVAQRLVKSGHLKGSIRAAVQGTTLVIRSSPPLNPGRRSPMGYAAVYEYGGRTGRRPRRAFIDPTMEQWETTGKTEERFGAFLDWVANDFRAG